MEAKRINMEVVCWIGDWLDGRTQRVKVNSEMSEEGEVDLGVPQGTVLGPCLFYVFIDDADDCVVGQTELIKFADDMKELRTVETDQDWQELQSTLDKLCDWADTWGMSFNVEKCKVMHNGRSSNPEREYKMRGKNLTKNVN
jgi:ribonuclease P/MRP protein subunit RPP40